MPSFRKARESLSKGKFRLFRRRRSKRLRSTSSSSPVGGSPIIASTSDSLDLNGKGSDCSSVLISPSGIVAEVKADVVEGREVPTPVKEVKKYIGNAKSLHLVEYDENDHCPRISTPVAWAEEAGSVDNTADITVSLRANEIVAVDSVADLGVSHESEADVLHVAPRVKITKTAGSGEHLNFEYEEDYRNPPTIIPDFSDEERDDAHDAPNIAVDLGLNKTQSVRSMGEIEVGEEGETVTETSTYIKPIDAAREKFDQYPPTAIDTEEAVRDGRTVDKNNNGEDADDQYLPTITLVDNLEERDGANNPVNNTVAVRGAKITTVGNVTEVGIVDEGVYTVRQIMERRETADHVELLNVECEESTKCPPTTMSEETGRTKEEENENIDTDIACDDVDNAMSAAVEEHAATDRKEDEHIECRQDDYATKAIAADSIEHGTAADEEFEQTSQYDITSDAPNEVATETETEKQSNATKQVHLNSGDDEQTSLPNPKIISYAQHDKNENTILARRFNIGDHVQVVKKGHKRNGMRGTIEKQTKCYAFFKDDNTNETIRIMPCSLALVSCETSSTETYVSNLPSEKPSEFTRWTKEEESDSIDMVCDDLDNALSAADVEHAATVRKEDEHIECRQDGNNAKANAADSIESGAAEDEEFEETRQFDIMSDAPNEVAKATENEKKSNAADQTELKSGDDEQTCLPNPKMIGIAPPDNNESTILARRFNVGDHVQVLRKGHKRNGMRGTIVKQTKCYAFFKDDNTNETIRIMPCSLSLVTCEASSTETPIESLSLHIESQSKVSSESYLSSLPSKKPTDFPIRSSVKVVYEHSKYGGKEGIVQRHTAKYVVVVFKDKSPHKEVRISPKFLMKYACDDSVSSAITTSFSTDSEFNDEQGRNHGGMDTSIPSMSAAKEALSLGFGKYSLEKIILRNPKNLACVETAFQKIWGEGNYLNLEMPLDPKDLDADLPLTQTVFGKVFELYYAKVKEDDSCGLSYSKSKKVIAYYVHTNNLRLHEEMLADFGTLPPSKIWARRGHFLSPATKLKFNNEYGVKSIAADDVVMIEDLGTVGCGFISEQYLEALLGNNTEARRTLGIQVRIFIPTKGVFKGMLMRKQGINSKIQLNESLRKVLPSKSDEASDNGHIVIKRTFPSKDNFQGVGRLFQNPDDLSKNKIKSITKSFRDGLQKGTSCKLSPMYQRVLQGLGIPKDTLKQYIRQYQKNAENLCHTHVIGMSDPTNKLPPNSVFLTGTLELDRLFVSRSPCMEAEDGHVVKVVQTKPTEMRDDEWEWLQSLTFGAIIFGNPRPGDRPLPELIADGDLDGDLYFVLWHKTLLSLIQPVSFTNDELLAPIKDDTAKEKQYDPHWFDKTQRFISRIPHLHADIDQLIGMTYKASEAIDDIRDSDSTSFARAYKQALDAKKHGGSIFLPEHLWETVPNKLHKHLAK